MFKVGDKVFFDDGKYKIEGVVMSVPKRPTDLTMSVRLFKHLTKESAHISLPIVHYDDHTMFKSMRLFRGGKETFIASKPKNKPELE